MRAWAALRLGFLAFAAVAIATPVNISAASPHVEQADLNGDINNIMSAYIQTSVQRAESDHAAALLVVMNTPGGISTSMDEIVTDLLNSSVPVVVYVYPSGARAASAGLFVAEAADVLDRAPGRAELAAEAQDGELHPLGANATRIVPRELEQLLR